jgi:ATP-dependent DNA ligase
MDTDLQKNLFAHQLKHARCKTRASFQEALSWKKDKKYVYEVKEDGTRYFLQINPSGCKDNILTSRHISVKTGRFTEETRVKKFVKYKFPKEIGADTIFDGECVFGKMSSDSRHGIAQGEGTFVIWDIVFWKSQDVRDWPQWRRWKLLLILSEKFPDWMKLVPAYDDPKTLMERVIEEGLEGMVRKDTTAAYGVGWTKIKGEITEDCVIYDFEETKSPIWRKKGWIGSIKFGQWHEVKKEDRPLKPIQRVQCPSPGMVREYEGKAYRFFAVGSCSGMTEEMRENISLKREEFLGKVLEVKAQLRIPKTNCFRHPEFVRIRDDKNHWECTF